jgi:hypothetical protein
MIPAQQLAIVRLQNIKQEASCHVKLEPQSSTSGRRPLD